MYYVKITIELTFENFPQLVSGKYDGVGQVDILKSQLATTYTIQKKNLLWLGGADRRSIESAHLVMAHYRMGHKKSQ